MSMDRRGFLKLLGLAVAVGTAGLVAPALIEEPRRRIWQVGRNAPVRGSWAHYGAITGWDTDVNYRAIITRESSQAAIDRAAERAAENIASFGGPVRVIAARPHEQPAADLLARVLNRRI